MLNSACISTPTACPFPLAAAAAAPDCPCFILFYVHQQTRGAVRDGTKLAQAAFWYKTYIAAAAAKAEQTFEVSLLNSALGLLESSLLDALPAVWAATGQGSRDAFDAEQMRNAACLCANARGLLAGTPHYDAAGYVASNCTGEGHALHTPTC